MATNYEIKLTDQIRSFQIAPYTTNGPKNPLSSAPDDKASTADTTLLLYGRGSPQYGERIAENLVNILEHFSSTIEPVSPISGQLWLDRNRDPHQLRLYNMAKHLISVDPEGAGVDWFAIPYTNDADRDAILLRLNTSNTEFRLRIHRGADEQEEYIINIAAAVSTVDNNFIRFQVIPTPPASRGTGVWFYGDWNHVPLDGAPLTQSINANNYTIANLAIMTAGSDDQEAATKKYVDDEVAAATGNTDEIGELADVTITSPVVNNILIYDGISEWVNSTGTNIFLSLGGGTLTGEIFLSGNVIHNVGAPSADDDAATKKYVDDVIISVGTPNNLTDLSDVVISSPAIGEMLTFNGSFWINSTPATFITDNNILTTAGGLTLATPFNVALGYSFIDTDFVNKDYVDTQIGTLSGDGVVDGGSYDNSTKTLTLTRTIGLPDIDIVMVGAGAIDSTAITHEITDPNDPVLIPDGTPTLLFERAFFTNGTYPTVFGDDVFRLLNVELGKLLQPKGRLVFDTNGLDVVNLGPGAVTNQANPVLAGGAGVYAVGTNKLSVYVNGIKQLTSTSGRREVAALADFSMFQGTHTGLTLGTTYTFDISVNSQAAVTVSVLGSDAVRIGNLVNTINALADTNYHDSGTPDPKWAFGVVLNDGGLIFASSLPGSGSKIDLTDGSVDPLFDGMIGNGLTTGAYAIELPLSLGEENDYASVDYSYVEIGRVNRQSQLLQFTGSSTPPIGATIEVIIETSLYVDEL